MSRFGKVIGGADEVGSELAKKEAKTAAKNTGESIAETTTQKGTKIAVKTGKRVGNGIKRKLGKGTVGARRVVATDAKKDCNKFFGRIGEKPKRLSKARYASTYKERLNQTPKDGPKGKWTGKRGESTYESTDSKANEILKKDGVDGVKYDDAIPDFSPVSKGEVKIDGMTNNRQKNFDKADAALAKERGVTPKEIKQWREENGLTWHECNDTQTMQAVPTKINGTFGHLGGVGEINAAGR